MSTFADADILNMLLDSPDSVTIDGVTAKCWEDDGSEVVEDRHYGPGTIAEAIWIVVQTSKFPTAKIGDAGTLNSTPVKIIDRIKLDDGGITRLKVQK